MSYKEILVGTENGITTITLNRPEKLNAWTPTMGNEVKSAEILMKQEPYCLSYRLIF